MTGFILGMLVVVLIVVSAIIFFRQRRPILGTVLVLIALMLGYVVWASAVEVTDDDEALAPSPAVDDVVGTPTASDS